MSQNPDEQRHHDAADDDFESGLDYGAFAADEPDFLRTASTRDSQRLPGI
ncbi:hypothetical protein [Nesterenkonia pannonica]|nr:hypothetical protein [Nesterenkonia pannonica]